MNLPGYEPDRELAEHLIDLQQAAAPLALGMPRHPQYARRFGRELIAAFEAGRLLPIKNLTLSKEDAQNAI